MNTPYCPYCSSKTSFIEYTPEVEYTSIDYIPIGGIILCSNCRSKFNAKIWIENNNLISI